MTQQVRPAAHEAGDDLLPLTRKITQEVIGRYAEASGDYNPLHTDPGFAATTQFGGTIAHGMLVLAHLSEMLTATFGDRWVAGGRMKARFRAPARPGDMVTAGGRVTKKEDGVLRCEVECRNQAGEVLVTADVELPA